MSPAEAQPKQTELVDRHYRSLLKAISWRATGTLDTILLSWLITGHAGKAFSIGAAELLTKTFLYYFHERVWNRIRIGRVPRPKADFDI